MKDFLDTLGHAAQTTVSEGYYNLSHNYQKPRVRSLSLQKFIQEAEKVPIIAEVKLASPSLGQIRESTNIRELAVSLERGGAVALSVLTEPKYFAGSITRFLCVRKSVNLPLLMKDIIICPQQIDTAAAIGANAILLIQGLFYRGYCEWNQTQMIEYAHTRGVEVLLEAHTEEEFSAALETSADLVGINNRDLRSFQVDIGRTKRILQQIHPQDRLATKIVVIESGITGPQDIQELYPFGANAFLVGSSIMKAQDPERTIHELVMAL